MQIWPRPGLPILNKHLEGSGSNNTWIIESVPINDDKADEYGYTKKISYISTDKSLVQKMEFYNFDNELFKTIEMRDFIPERGKFMVSDMIANNCYNRKSEILFKDQYHC